MKKLLIIVCMIALFTNCNNSNSGGWSSQDRQKGLKACMDQMEGKLEDATAKKFCSCALEKAMQKWKTYAESENAPDDDPAGNEIAKTCLGAIQGGNGPEDPNGRGKGGGLLGGKGWSKTDKSTFLGQCENGLTAEGYSGTQARQLCSCVLGKLEKKYSSLSEGNEKGGEQAGSTAMQECAAGTMDNNGDNDNNDDN